MVPQGPTRIPERFGHPKLIFCTNHWLVHHLLYAASLLPLQLLGMNSLQTLKLQLLSTRINVHNRYDALSDMEEDDYGSDQYIN